VGLAPVGRPSAPAPEPPTATAQPTGAPSPQWPSALLPLHRRPPPIRATIPVRWPLGCYLRRDAMKSSSDLYTADLNEEAQVTVSSLRAPTDQPRQLPKAVVITNEADLSCDVGEAYAGNLRQEARRSPQFVVKPLHRTSPCSKRRP